MLHSYCTQQIGQTVPGNFLGSVPNPRGLGYVTPMFFPQTSTKWQAQLLNEKLAQARAVNSALSSQLAFKAVPAGPRSLFQAPAAAASNLLLFLRVFVPNQPSATTSHSGAGGIYFAVISPKRRTKPVDNDVDTRTYLENMRDYSL